MSDGDNKMKRVIWYENPKLFFRTAGIVGVMGGFILYAALISVAGTIQSYEWKVALPEIKRITMADVIADCLDKTDYFGGGGIDPQKLNELMSCIKAGREQHGF